MIFRRVFIYFIFFLLIFFNFSNCKSAPVNPDSSFPDDGFIRLVIDEKTGGFSLFYLANPQRMRYEELFHSSESSASYTSVSINGNISRLGDKNTRPVLEWQRGNPVLKFESNGIIITQAFSPVRTSGSAVDNGVMITYTIRNSTAQASSVGLLLLLDTTLGEERKMIPFITETLSITSETLLDGSSSGRYWISRGNSASLMGSIANPLGNTKPPDYIHFANWKRLHDSAWRLEYSQGRTLGSDSAVCYIYEPVLIERGGVITYSIFLATEDENWIKVRQPAEIVTQEQEIILPVTIHIPEPEVQLPAAQTPAVKEEIPVNDVSGAPVTIDIYAIEEEVLNAAIINNENAEIMTLIRLQEILIQFLNGEIVLNEQDLSEIERAVQRLRN